jgi:hypothetical protein
MLPNHSLKNQGKNQAFFSLILGLCFLKDDVYVDTNITEDMNYVYSRHIRI